MSDQTGLHAFQWIWEGESQLAEDAYVNTWHFWKSDLPIEDFDNVRDMLVNFWSVEAPGAGNTLTDFLCNESLTGKFTIKAYDLTEPKPRAPKYEFSDTFGLGSSVALPTEVSLVMSFQAVKESGENQKRRRNRVYLGPLAYNALGNGRNVADGLVETVLFAGKQLLNESEESATWFWMVYSPTDDAMYTVEDGWVDNAYDTQRRRGTAATARGIYNLDEPT